MCVFYNKQKKIHASQFVTLNISMETKNEINSFQITKPFTFIQTNYSPLSILLKPQHMSILTSLNKNLP